MATISDSNSPFVEIKPFPVRRNLVVDAGYLANKRHIIHGLVEVDVTEAREEIKKRNISFTAYLVACVGRAVAQDASVAAYRNWRGQLVIFHNDVDIVTMMEPSEHAVAIPHIIRHAESRSVKEISDEIRAVQSKPRRSAQENRGLNVAARFPRWVRMLAFSWFRQNPHRFKRIQGTVILTSVGMFGKSGGYGVGFLPCHTLGLTIGGIAKKPGITPDGRIEPRDFLNLTVSFDHDIVDGAPAARFTSRLVDLIGSASHVLEKEEGEKRD